MKRPFCIYISLSNKLAARGTHRINVVFCCWWCPIAQEAQAFERVPKVLCFLVQFVISTYCGWLISGRHQPMVCAFLAERQNLHLLPQWWWRCKVWDEMGVGREVVCYNSLHSSPRGLLQKHPECWMPWLWGRCEHIQKKQMEVHDRLKPLIALSTLGQHPPVDALLDLAEPPLVGPWMNLRWYRNLK